MIEVTYKKITGRGTIHVPYEKKDIDNAKQQANRLYKKGYLNVKVAEVKENILYVPGGK